MSSGQGASTVFDTGVLLELAVDAPESRETRDAIAEGKVSPVTGELNVAEMSYILCRRVGAAEATRSVGLLRAASQFRVLPPSDFLDRAASIKCTRRVSFVDCVTLAMGEVLGAPVMFARKEKELSREMSKSPFKVKLLFMNE